MIFSLPFSFLEKKGKACIRTKRWPIRLAVISGFSSIKRLGVLLLPPGKDALLFLFLSPD